MQALHQGGYGYYVYVFLGNIMEIYIIDLYYTFLNLVFYVVRCNIAMYVHSYIAS